MEGRLVGVFGSGPQSRAAFCGAVGKKSESEGVAVYRRTEGGEDLYLLDEPSYPERIQGAARIASICDTACFLYPQSGKLTVPDGELAVLIDSFGLGGAIEVFDGVSAAEDVRATFRGSPLSRFAIEERSSGSSILRLGVASQAPQDRTMVYVDRAFAVKGVGTVALGFVLSGEVSVHDELRMTPGEDQARVEVRGIQVSDVDHTKVGRGVRVGLSLKGVDAGALQKCHWLDDGSCALSSSVELDFRKSPFYKEDLVGREMHLEVLGELVPASLKPGAGGDGVSAVLPGPIPVWPGLRAAVVDLNGKGLRVAGGGVCKL